MMVKRKPARTTRRTVRRKSKQEKPANAAAFNREAQWKAYRELQMRADRAWDQFRKDVRKNADSEILLRDHTHLLLLLGECNYMARECMRMANKRKKSR